MTEWKTQTLGGVAALLGVALFVLVVVTLHLLQPGYQPRDQLMSELALGEHGWVMFVAFLGLAMAILGIQAGVKSCGGSRDYRVLLGTTAASFLAAGVFPLGETYLIHISAVGIAFVLSVLAMYLFPSAAGRASAACPRTVSWPLAACVVAGVALGHSVIPMGTGQRVAAACLLLWLGIAGWKLPRL